MPQAQPDEETELITIDIDLPVPVYLEALRVARELGIPSLEECAQQPVDKRVEDDAQQAGDDRRLLTHDADQVAAHVPAYGQHVADEVPKAAAQDRRPANVRVSS